MVLKNIPVYRKPFSMNCGWKMLDTTDKYANTRLIRSVYVCVCVYMYVCVCVCYSTVTSCTLLSLRTCFKLLQCVYVLYFVRCSTSTCFILGQLIKYVICIMWLHVYVSKRKQYLYM